MYFLGVDGGGTKTAAILMDAQGKVVRTTRKGTGNIAVLDRGSVAQLIRSILQELLPDGDTENIRWATFAFAGAGRPQEREGVTAIIRNTGIRNFTVLSDAEILYYSIFGEEQGILISAGTGSICLVKGKDNQYHQIGGWGYLLGDEGSGFYIGSKAIRKALHDAELGLPPSRLTEKLLTFYGIGQPKSLITVVYSSVNPVRLIASCARLVCEMAEHGDPEALAIVDDAAQALLNMALEAIRYFGGEMSQQYNISLAGSILTEIDIVARKFKEKAAGLGLQLQYITPRMETAAAAVLYSFQQAGIEPGEKVRQQLQKLKVG